MADSEDEAGGYALVMGEPQPPPLPKRPNPDLAGKVVTYSEDGAAWRWSGSAWVLIDPPGTHQDEMRRVAVVQPLADLAFRLVFDGVPEDEAIRTLLLVPGCDQSSLSKAATMMSDSENDQCVSAGELLRAAAVATR